MTTKGIGPCHITLDSEHGLILVADYAGQTFVAYSYSTSTGQIMDLVFEQHFGAGSNAVPQRQEMAHPHGSFVFGNFIYLCDLGSDKIWHFQVCIGTL